MFRTRSFFRPFDALLLAVVAAASAWGFLAFRFNPAGKAIVYVGDRKYGWFDLAAPSSTIAIPTRIGDVELQVGGGYARVLHSPCPNKLCVHTGAIKQSHSEIVCLPARLLVVLEGGGDPGDSSPQPDAITY